MKRWNKLKSSFISFFDTSLFQVADGGEIKEEELEALGEKMREVVILLQNIKTDFQTEIDRKINEYCSSKREKVENFILGKKLTEDSIIER